MYMETGNTMKDTKIDCYLGLVIKSYQQEWTS